MSAPPQRAWPAPTFWLLPLLGLLSAVLVAFSQLGGVYDGDEGLHLVAALLVRGGQKPYVDFFYWHEPLYLYVASAWMALAGDGWRSVHVLSALLTAICTLLVGTYSSGYLQATSARLSEGVAGASLFALNALVMKWGTIGHNYALGLCLSVAAFRLVILAANRPGVSLAFWAGLCVGAAVATSLLLVLSGPVLLIWLIVHSRSGTRRAKALVFLAATIIPFFPLIWLALDAPRQTLFGVVTHHLFYRVPVEDATALHFEILFSWLKSPQALLLILLSGLGLWFLARDRDVDPAKRREIHLCAWLVVSLGIFAATTHPPVRAPYFVLVTPFLAILASVGTHAIARRLWLSARAEWLVVIVVGVFGLGLLGSVYRERLWVSEWRRIEAFAEEVNRVTPAESSFYTTFAFVYFAARHSPPPGLENGWASHMSIPEDELATLHVVPASQIAERVQSGRFDTILLWRGDARFDPGTLERVYGQSKALDHYFVLRWNQSRD